MVEEQMDLKSPKSQGVYGCETKTPELPSTVLKAVLPDAHRGAPRVFTGLSLLRENPLQAD